MNSFLNRATLTTIAIWSSNMKSQLFKRVLFSVVILLLVSFMASSFLTKLNAQESVSLPGSANNSHEIKVESASKSSLPLKKDILPTLNNQTRATKTTKKSVDVLIDMRHAHDFSDYPLTLDDVFYHRLYSFHRAFESLRSLGLQIEKSDMERPLTSEILSNVKVLFLNLPSADKEPFLSEEIVAIRDFLRDGGAAFFITDHTNCYFHQTCLTPLFHELDILPQKYGVCDKDQILGQGEGWIYIDNFDEDHPVVQGLREIAFQTGGGVDPRYAIAWSGPNSWQDAPGLPIYGEADVAYFGNFSPDPDEKQGRTGVVLAKEFGKGKIVIVGDQNLFSPFFFQYLDVYRLWLNAFAWLLNSPEIADFKTYCRIEPPSSLIVCWEDLGKGFDRFGNPDSNGYYHIYTQLCRRYNTFCIAHDDHDLTSQLLLILHGERHTEEGFAYALRQLKEGRAILVLDPPVDVWKNAQNELPTLLQKLEEEGVRLIENNDQPINLKKERYEFSNGAKITLLRGSNSFNNINVPKPEKAPLMLEGLNIKALVQEIDELLAQ